MNKILIICGPTASGKTSLAIQCAKLLESEVISADSMNIYKKLNIGTAKPTDTEKCGVVHHLIDVVEPTGSFTVSDYKSIATPIIDELIAKGKVPVICGGTGFYINSILYDFSYGKGMANSEIREYYKRLALENGNKYVYDILKEKDGKSAEKIHYNDIKRVIRALEIFENGIKKSEINDDLTPKYDYVAYSFNLERELLYSNINDRVDLMIKQGLVDEVRDLVEEGITLDNQCMQGIGYKEIYSYLQNEISLEDAVELIKINTRHYAKRQTTFFKKLPNLRYINKGDNIEIAKKIIREF